MFSGGCVHAGTALGLRCSTEVMPLQTNCRSPVWTLLFTQHKKTHTNFSCVSQQSVLQAGTGREPGRESKRPQGDISSYVQLSGEKIFLKFSSLCEAFLERAEPVLILPETGHADVSWLFYQASRVIASHYSPGQGLHEPNLTFPVNETRKRTINTAQCKRKM